MYKKGSIVMIRPEFQDEGDALLRWVVLDDEEKDRLDISPLNLGLPIPPIHTVRTDQVIEFSELA
jgi:hypothetical protein